MKLPGIILLSILLLSLGFAAGAYFAPEAFRHSEAIAPSSSSSIDVSNPNAQTGMPGHGTSNSSAGKAGDLASILQERPGFQQTRDLAAYADGLRVEDIPDAIAKIESDVNSISTKNQIVALLMSKWAEIDPKGLVEWLQKNNSKPGMIGLGYGALAERNPSTAFQEAQQLPAGQKRDEALMAIADKLPESDDLTKAWEVAKNIKVRGFGGGGNSPYSIFGRWAEKDPTQAMQAFLQLSGEQKRLAVNGMVTTLVRKDSQAAVALLSQMPAGKIHDSVQQALISTWVGLDPQAALAWVQSLPSSVEKDKAFGQMAGNLNFADAQAAWTVVQSLPPSQAKDDAIPQIIGKLGQTDLAAALNLVNQMPPGPVSDRARLFIASSWTQSDPQAALAYWQTLPPGDMRNNFFVDATDAMFAKDPASAVDFLKKLPDETRNRLIGLFAQSWTSSDLTGATAYATTMPPGPAQNNLLRAVAAQLAFDDPAKAMNWINQLQDGEGKIQAASNVLSQWAQNDPTTAAKWVTGLSDSPQKDNAYASIAQAFGNNDPVKAANWLTQLPAGSSRDAAVIPFSNQVFNTDPERAVQWAASIGDPKVQQTQITTLLRRWMHTDPTKATVAVQSSSLPDDVKAQLLQTKH